MSKTQTIDERIEQTFPAPDFRPKQKAAIREVVKGIEGDADVTILDAPTGAGKSLILYTAMAVVNGEGFFTTPLNSLVDQLDEDEFIAPNVIAMKGRNNYECIHPEDKGESVDQAICQRDQNFECEFKENSCPYYSKKKAAINHPNAVTNMSYIMAESMIPRTEENEEWVFGDRDTLVVDECQKIEDFAMSFISFTVSKYTVPDDVWYNIDLPKQKMEDDMDFLVEWVEGELMDTVKQAITRMDSANILGKDENKDLENLKQFKLRVDNFLKDVKENDWIADIDWEIKKNRPNEQKIVFKPIIIGRFLDSFLWSRADNIVLSSATVPGGNWLDEIGLGGKSVKHVSVPSQFPIENRPIMTKFDVGKMTYNERDDNMWPMAKRIKAIADHYDGDKGFIHCRSYSLAESLKRSFQNHIAKEDNPFDEDPAKWFKENCMVQDRERREESLEAWKENDKQLFFSVAMDEGIDLEGDLCRFQILAKVLYGSMNDRRTEYRIKQRNDWDWYNRKAAVQIQQAYGRGVRSAEDWCHFYLLDSSAKGLIKRNEGLFQSWFLEAIQDMDVDPSKGM